MAAYAALVSLMNVMDQIQDHPYHSTSLDTDQIASLREKLDFLLDFIEAADSHGVKSKEAQVVETQIAFAAYAAEDVIESHVVDQIQGGLFSLLDLWKVIQDIDLVKEKVVELKEERCIMQLTYSSTPASLSRSHTRNKNGHVVVGLDEELIQLLDRLTGQSSNRQFIAVTGMGGIGKTTLAKTAYEHLLIVHHFDIRAWVTVSQTYDVREILLQLLSRPSSEIGNETDEQLGEQLHKKLWGRRYLVVVDDIWSIEAWDRVNNFLPDNGNGSRIVVTTRISNVAVHFDSGACVRLSFLDDDKSWNLFCEKAFGGGASCVPRELEDIGKEIVTKCRGLPLSIVVIGGLLGKSHRVQEYWNCVAKDLISILDSGEGDDDCLNVLSLSYTYLPAHLKPCFLYMGVFPEDNEIRASELIKLWVAEGFIKPNKAQSVEEIARGYFNDLIDRNLILQDSLGSNGEIRTCKIHDILRGLCLKLGGDHEFMCMMKDIYSSPRIDTMRRIAFNEVIPEAEYYYRVFPALQSASLIRTLVTSMDRCPVPLNNRLLRVFNLVDVGFSENIFDQLNLRYVGFEYCSLLSNRLAILPLSISLLWNMQTLIIEGEVHAPSAIWEMRQLRHLDIDSLYLPDPPPGDQRDDSIALRNLQTLKRAVNFTWSEEVCKRIPNVKKLNMRYDEYGEGSNDYCFYNLCSLHKLESLRWSNALPNHLLHNLASPTSLKKLTLENCDFDWEDLTMIGSLPCLEVLKVKANVSGGAGPVWNPVEGEFGRLKFLLIQDSNLVYWTADQYHFPVLESLVLVNMEHLVEIPLDVGEIATLRVISLYCCSESAAVSTFRIAEEQESAENEGLRVRVEFVNKAQVESFWKKAAGSMSSSSSNFQISTVFSNQY